MLNVLNSEEFFKSHFNRFIRDSFLEVISSSSSKAVLHMYMQEQTGKTGKYLNIFELISVLENILEILRF